MLSCRLMLSHALTDTYQLIFLQLWLEAAYVSLVLDALVTATVCDIIDNEFVLLYDAYSPHTGNSPNLT